METQQINDALNDSDSSEKLLNDSESFSAEGLDDFGKLGIRVRRNETLLRTTVHHLIACEQTVKTFDANIQRLTLELKKARKEIDTLKAACASLVMKYEKKKAISQRIDAEEIEGA